MLCLMFIICSNWIDKQRDVEIDHGREVHERISTTKKPNVVVIIEIIWDYPIPSIIFIVYQCMLLCQRIRASFHKEMHGLQLDKSFGNLFHFKRLQITTSPAFDFYKTIGFYFSLPCIWMNRIEWKSRIENVKPLKENCENK